MRNDGSLPTVLIQSKGRERLFSVSRGVVVSAIARACQRTPREAEIRAAPDLGARSSSMAKPL